MYPFFNCSIDVYEKRSQQDESSTPFVGCCEAVTKIIRPKGVLTKSGDLVRLKYGQYLTETKCLNKVDSEECGDPLSPKRKFSCKQNYGYVEALVTKDIYRRNQTYIIDEVKVRRGCLLL